MPLQKPHPFTISIWYGANMYIPVKITNSWKCENPMLIWYLFNKCGWLGILIDCDIMNIYCEIENKMQTLIGSGLNSIGHQEGK